MCRYEGLVLSVGGNGRSYILILEAGPLADLSQSKLYFARFSTKLGFCRVRSSFFSFNQVFSFLKAPNSLLICLLAF